MADRIKGITAEIGGDPTGLSKALAGVNKERIKRLPAAETYPAVRSLAFFLSDYPLFIFSCVYSRPHGKIPGEKIYIL